MNNRTWSYSFNGENYFGEFNTKDGAIKEAVEEAKENYYNDVEISIGKNKIPIISDYFYFDSFIERLEEEVNEKLTFTDGNNLIDIEDKELFKKALKKLINKHCSTKYFIVEDIEKGILI